MGAPKKWTDEQVEEEIKRLNGSKQVKLAQKEIRIKNRRRQHMWYLQHLEARGKQLESLGITFENIENELFGNSIEAETEI